MANRIQSVICLSLYAFTALQLQRCTIQNFSFLRRMYTCAKFHSHPQTTHIHTATHTAQSKLVQPVHSVHHVHKRCCTLGGRSVSLWCRIRCTTGAISSAQPSHHFRAAAHAHGHDLRCRFLVENTFRLYSATTLLS